MIATYCTNLKKIREELNLSAQKLADKLGVSQSSIAQYEIGKREPNFNFILQLNIKLNINLNWFCTGEGNMFNHKTEEQRKEISSIAVELYNTRFEKDFDKRFEAKIREYRERGML